MWKARRSVRANFQWTANHRHGISQSTNKKTSWVLILSTQFLHKLKMMKIINEYQNDIEYYSSRGNDEGAGMTKKYNC